MSRRARKSDEPAVQLKLPLDERGRRRAANRAEWFNQVDKPLELHDIIGA